MINHDRLDQLGATPPPGDSAAVYLADLASPDEQTRARAALALHRLGHPRALEACLQTLDDAPDPLHLDITPAVHCLRQIGRPALPLLLDRLLADDRLTRRRAEQVALWVTKLDFGFDGRAWAKGGLNRWTRWWATIGYDADATEADRRQAVARLAAWLAAD